MRASIYFSLLLLGLVITSSAAVWQFYFRQSPNMLRPRENDSSLASIPIHSIESSSVTSDAEYDEAVTSAPSAIVREIIATYAPTAAVAAATTTPPAVKEWLQGSKHNLVMIDDSFMLPAFEPSTALDPPVIGFGKYLNQNIHLSLESSEVHKNSNPKHQAAVFDLLRAATKVFDALNISYFLSHGTLLGSFRHGDMLKWDYDIDIVVFKEDMRDNAGSRISAALDAFGATFEKYYLCRNKPYSMVQFYTRTAGGVGPYDDNAEVSICDDSTIGMWSKICLKKERHTCMDVWTLLPVTIKNTTMYAISAEPELYTRSDILPLKPCLLRGRLFSCPQRTRLMLGYQYLPSIRPPWKCTTLSSDETDPDVHLSCESSSKIAEASYIGDYDSFSPNRQFPDVPIMYYNRTERRVLMHLPRHVTRRVDELRSNDPRGVSFPPLAVAVASSAFAPRRLQAQQLNEL